ncbi:hypothetical protein ABPG74_019997 [Tetrahymena malaccensis]
MEDCQLQGQFYSTQLPFCGKCSQDCSECFDSQRCIFCQQMQYLEVQGSNCVSSCQEGYYANKYFRECKECQVNNCQTCDDQGQICLKCKQGWILNNDGLTCQNAKCKDIVGTYYDQETDTCKFYCNQGYDQNSMQCFQFRQINGITEEMPRLKYSNDLDIYQIAIEQIEDQATVIALDLERAVYYTYPELIPYFEIDFNQTAYFTFLRRDYIFIINSDQNNFQRINIQTTNVDYYQLGFCQNPIIEQNYLVCMKLNLINFNIINLDSAQIEVFQFSSSSRILQYEEIDQKQQILFDQSLKTIKKLEASFFQKKEQESQRSLQDQPQNTDQFGCFIQYPQQFDYQPKLIENIQKLSFIKVDANITENINKQQINVFLLEDINLLLIYQKQYSSLYQFDTNNLNNNSQIIQFQNVSQVACASSLNSSIQLFLFNLIDSTIGYYLSSTQDSGQYQFDQTNAIQFKNSDLGNLLFCKFTNQSKSIYLQGDKGFLLVEIDQMQEFQQKNMVFKSEQIVQYDDNFLISFQTNQQEYKIKIYLMNDQSLDEIKQYSLSSSYFYFSNTPTTLTIMYDQLQQNIILANRNEIQLIHMQPSLGQQQLVFSRYGRGRIHLTFKQVNTIYYLENYNGICIVYQNGFQIIFDNNNEQSITRYVDFDIYIYEQKDNYLVLGNNIVKKCLIFDINLQEFIEIHFDNQTFQRIFTEKTTQYIVIAIQLQNNTFNLYTLNQMQGIVGYHFNYNLLYIFYAETIQSYQDYIYITSDQNTVLIYSLKQNKLNFINSFYYSNYFQILDEQNIFIFSKCQNQFIFLSIFNIQNQTNNQVLLQVEELIYSRVLLLYFQNLQRVVFQCGRYDIYIFDLQKNQIVDQIQNSFYLYQLFQFNSQIIYVSQLTVFIYNVQTLNLKQVSIPNNPANFYQIVANNQQYFPVYFPALGNFILYNVDIQIVQQRINSDQSINAQFIQLQNKEVFIFELSEVQKFVVNKVYTTLVDDLKVSQFIQYNDRIAGFIYINDFGILDTISKTSYNITLKKDSKFWFIYQEQYYYITNENELCNEQFEVIIQLGDILYYNFDQRSSILVTLDIHQIVNFYLFNIDKTISLYVQYGDYLVNISFNQFENLNLVLVVLQSASYQAGYFINYQLGTYFEFLNNQNQIYFRDGLFINDNYIITFQFQSIFEFQVFSGGVNLIKQYQPSGYFINIYNTEQNQLQFKYNYELNQLILISLQKYTLCFDLDSFNINCQYYHLQNLAFIYFSKQNVIIYLQTNSFSVLYLTSCVTQSKNLMSIAFSSYSFYKVQYDLNIFLIESSDLLILISTNGLEVYQFSTLNYLLTNSYQYTNMYYQIQSFIIEETNEIIFQYADFSIQIYDLSTALASSDPIVLGISTENNFLFFNETKLIAQLNQNSGVVEIKEVDSQNLKQQIKIKSQYSNQKFSFFFQNISFNRIFIFTSLQEYHIIDVQTYNYTIYQIPFKCLHSRYYNLSIYCLNELSQIFKFNQISNRFDIIYQQSLNQNISAIEILSDNYIQIQYINGNFTLFSIQELLESDIIDSTRSPYNIQMVDDLLLIVQTQQKLTVYLAFLSSSSTTSKFFIQKMFEYQNSTQSYIINRIITSYLLIYSTNQCSFIYDIFGKELIGVMQNAAQDQQNIYIENEHIYIFGLSTFLLYDRNTFKKINYYKVNQFLFSNILSVKYIESDYFAVILQEGIHVVKMNLKQNYLIQTFNNLYYPTILYFQINYNSFQQLTQLIIYGYSDTSLFQLNVSQLDLQQSSNLVAVEVPLQLSQIQTNQMHMQLQTDVSNQKKLLGQYIISLEKTQVQISDIPVYYNEIFTNQTQIQIQPASWISENITTLVISDNNFINQLFSQLIFFNIELQIKANQNVLNLNPYLSIQKIVFDKVFLKFNPQSYALNISNCQQLIYQQVVIQNQNITNQMDLMNVYDIDQVRIDELLIQNVNISSQSFEAKNDQVSYDSKNLTQFSQDQLDNNQITKYFIMIYGCFLNEFYNFEISSYDNMGLIKSVQYYLTLSNQFFTNLFLMKNITINNYFFNQKFQFINLLANVIKIDNLQIKNSKFSIDCISLNPQSQATIINSHFNQIQLLQGSVFNILGGLINFSNTTFQAVSSQTSAALSCSQSQSLSIIASQFINISCKYSNNYQKCMGGALNLQQIRILQIAFSSFYNAFSTDYGGAIYINNQNNYITQINNTVFNNCQVKTSSGGAIYIQQSQNISIFNSTFSNNTALLERGGAIGLYYSNLVQLKNSLFLYNKAQTGGAIWYSPTNQTFLEDQNVFKNNIFGVNEGFFYGQDIGSYPRSIQRVTSKREVIMSNKINQIQSGNVISQEMYFTFYDEQEKPLDFVNSEKYPQSLEIQNEQITYFLKVQLDKNPMILIKSGYTLERLPDLGVFQLSISLSYKENQTQSIHIQSNPLVDESQLVFSLILNFRDCIRGEIIQSENGFIQCYECPEGKYSLVQPNYSNTNNLICQSCPSQAIKCSKDSIILKDGYWRETIYTDKIYICQTYGCSETQEKVIDRCLEGYIGPLCDTCDGFKQIWQDQYGKQGRSCILCKELKYQYIYFSVIIVCYSIYLALCVGNLINQKIFVIKLIMFRRIELLITSKSCSQGETVTFWIKIFVHYLQISSLIFSFGIEYPYVLSAPVSAFGDPNSLTLTSLDCLSPLSQKSPIWQQVLADYRSKSRMLH